MQWATDPTWGHLGADVRDRLLSADVAFLVRQLANPNCRVVVNGRTAMHWVETAGITRWHEVCRMPGPPSAGVFLGDSTSTTFVG